MIDLMTLNKRNLARSKSSFMVGELDKLSPALTNFFHNSQVVPWNEVNALERSECPGTNALERSECPGTNALERSECPGTK
jgi:hypothetical protein